MIMNYVSITMYYQSTHTHTHTHMHSHTYITKLDYLPILNRTGISLILGTGMLDMLCALFEYL
jgi:hypothetical protein